MRFKFTPYLMPLAAVLMSCSDGATAPSKSTPLTQNETITDTTPEISITSGALSGLYRNAGPDSPVILIVPGSGPTDLNGNSPLGVSSNTYKLLSESLAADGISTVRVDKRGMFSSAEAGDPNAVTIEIYADDYKSWLDTIRAETGQPCVYMLGHSEGALMVSAASIENEHVCGLILVAGVGRPFGDVLREQLKANPANIIIMKEAVGIIETLERGERADTADMHVALRPLFGSQVQDFMISLMQADPAELAKKANKDTLIIQGENDIQVSTLDAEKLAAASGGKLVMIEGMNHVLKDAPKSRRGNIATYRNADLPISDGVTEAIREFVGK